MYLSLSFLYRYNDIMTAGILKIIQNSVINAIMFALEASDI